MSIKIASKIWDLRGIPPITKFVLIKLADNADDYGRCWPSVLSIANDCEVSDRTIQIGLKWAENNKLIRREMRPGKRSIYHVTPEEYSPPKNIHPEDYDITPPKITTSTPEDYDITHIEPSKRTIKVREPSNGTTFDHDFEEFWKLYPRHVAKQSSLKAYTRTRKEGTTHETIIRGLNIYIGECAGKEQQYIAHASTWLNGRRWDDQPAKPSSPNGKASFLTAYERALHASIHIPCDAT